MSSGLFSQNIFAGSRPGSSSGGGNPLSSLLSGIGGSNPLSSLLSGMGNGVGGNPLSSLLSGGGL
ncbi:MAG: hypothetical protein RR332_00940, partial [Clostridiales bacterium]